jgi:hypothetical protein
MLLTSIHDVSPRFEREIDSLFDRIAPITGANHLAMLVVPDYWGVAPLQKSPSYHRKLRDWSRQGVEMFLHGWHHRAESPPQRRVDRMRGNFMTAGEGEFLAMDRLNAVQKMRDGRKLIEDIISSPVSGFVAPAWLYGGGTLEAMRELQFSMAEDHLSVWNPTSGETLASGPVVTWASRSAMRTASSLAFARMAPAILSRFSVARIAVHPGDVSKSSILTSIDHCMARLLAQGRTPGRYSDLLSAAERLAT